MTRSYIFRHRSLLFSGGIRLANSILYAACVYFGLSIEYVERALFILFFQEVILSNFVYNLRSYFLYRAQDKDAFLTMLAAIPIFLIFIIGELTLGELFYFAIVSILSILLLLLTLARDRRNVGVSVLVDAWGSLAGTIVFVAAVAFLPKDFLGSYILALRTLFIATIIVSILLYTNGIREISIAGSRVQPRALFSLLYSGLLYSFKSLALGVGIFQHTNSFLTLESKKIFSIVFDPLSSAVGLIVRYANGRIKAAARYGVAVATSLLLSWAILWVSSFSVMTPDVSQSIQILPALIPLLIALSLFYNVVIAISVPALANYYIASGVTFFMFWYGLIGQLLFWQLQVGAVLLLISLSLQRLKQPMHT